MLSEIIAVVVLFIITLIVGIYGGNKDPIPSEHMAQVNMAQVVQAPAGILRPAGSTPKGLSVKFADVKNERIFSKKTGKIKMDKIKEL